MRYVLWGWNPKVLPVPIKIMGGTLRQAKSAQKYREEEGWLCAIYEKGTEPVGLRLQVEEIKKQSGDA